MHFKGRRLLLLIPAAVAAAATMAVSPAGAGGKDGYGCPTGFDLGALTNDQGLALPRVQAGLAAGVFDVGGLTAYFNKVDHNGDGVVCFKDVGALNGGGQAIWAYAYNIVDDNASVPGG
jgi:hypothetical protein